MQRGRKEQFSNEARQIKSIPQGALFFSLQFAASPIKDKILPRLAIMREILIPPVGCFRCFFGKYFESLL